jgi:hypothetical protein
MKKQPDKKIAPRIIEHHTLIPVLLILLSLTSFTGTSATRANATVHQENNGLAQTPLMGWSSWSTIRYYPSEAAIKTQAQALANSPLKAHGYTYINQDDYWYLNPSTTVDHYGRWSVDTGRFPDGMAAVASYVHSLGLKFGLYLTPGIPVAAVHQNTPIQGTSYHARDIADTSRYETNYRNSTAMYYIDYSKPGAQAFINSWADELASWDIDFLKIDGVGDWDIPDIRAWSTALKQSGRSIYFHLSNNLDVNYASIWQKNANGWRIDGDVECYCSTLVTWNSFSSRFNDVPAWINAAGPGGWNDLDSLDVGNGSKDGLSNDERQTYMTLWAISAAPLYTGDDLTTLDSYGISLLTNDEVIAVDHAGHPAHPISQASNQQVWFSNNGNGSYTVALFNLDSAASTVTANWRDLGFSGAATVRDQWSHTDLGTVTNSFSATLNGHASRLLKVVPASNTTLTPTHNS